MENATYDKKFKKLTRVRLGDVFPTIIKCMIDAGWVDKTPTNNLADYPETMELFSDGKSGKDSLYFKVYFKDGALTSSATTYRSATKLSKDSMNTRALYTIRKNANDAEYAFWYMPIATSGDYNYTTGSSAYMSDGLSSDYLCDLYVYADKECVSYAIRHGLYYNTKVFDVVWSLQVPETNFLQPLVNDSIIHRIVQFSSCATQGVDSCIMYHEPKNAPSTNNPTSSRISYKIDYLKDTLTPSMNMDMRLLTPVVFDATLGLISKPSGVFLVKPNQAYIRSGNTVTVTMTDGSKRKAVFIEAPSAYRSYGMSIGGYVLMLEDS